MNSSILTPKRFILTISIPFLLSSCSSLESFFSSNKQEFSKGVSAGSINSKFLPIKKGENKNTDGYVSLSSHFFDASKRVGISTYDVKYTQKNGLTFRPRYLAEEQPDIAYEITSAFNTSISAVQGDNIDAKLELASSYLSAVRSLTNKSKTLNLARSLGYRMNEGVFNGNLTNKNYDTVFDTLISSIERLQLAEFESENKKLKYRYKTYTEMNNLLSKFKDLGINKDIIEKTILNFVQEIDMEVDGLSQEDLKKVENEVKSKVGNKEKGNDSNTKKEQ